MAEYTMELRHVVEHNNIFDFAYPFYDESKRAKFEDSFIRHFYFREICVPSVERFKVYLRDKMETVFPYYNEMFNASLIKYDVLDNYKLTEEFTRKVESKDKAKNEGYSVGQLFDNAESESNQDRKTETTGNIDGKTETHDKTHTEGENNNKLLKKYSDTPQGRTELTDSKYLTNLTDETTTGSTQSEQTVDGETTNTQETTGSEATKDNLKSTSKQEQKTTQDNITRTDAEREQSESYTITRRGNIGVDTDSDGILKHLKLQKVLKEIEIQFFNECEDLFLLVY